MGSNIKEFNKFVEQLQKVIRVPTSQETELVIGEVKGVSPLEIVIPSSNSEEDEVLSGDLLVLSPLCQTIEVPATINETIETDDTTCSEGASRKNKISRLNNKFTITLHFELNKGDTVIMIRLNDSNCYYVQSKVYDESWQ